MNVRYKIKVIVTGFFLVLLCAENPAFAQGSLSSRITEGNKLYNDGEYDKALTKYNDAQIEAPTSPEIFFNMGNVFFRQGKYKEAIDSYQKSMEKGDINIEAKSMYNIGNALFQQGQLRGALEYYKQALERNPDDVDAKYNIEYTERMIKEMLSKAQETMQKAQQEQQKREAQEQQSAQNSKKEENAEDQEKQMESASQQEVEKKNGEAKGERRTETDKKEGDERQAQKAQAGKTNTEDKEDLSEEEAERFLSAFERDKRGNPLLNQQKSRRGRGYNVEKDW